MDMQACPLGALLVGININKIRDFYNKTLWSPGGFCYYRENKRNKKEVLQRFPFFTIIPLKYHNNSFWI